MKTLNSRRRKHLLLQVVTLFVVTVSLLNPFRGFSETKESTNNTKSSVNVGFSLRQIYQQLNCPELSFDAFQLAYNGFNMLRTANQVMVDSVLTVVDFSKASVENRFFIIDVKNFKVVFKTLVAHGRNSGDLFAQKFSNKPESYESSLGLYVTGSTYSGKHGYSLVLNGMEKGINDKARERAIVIHSADYVSQDYIERYGRIGRSLGCPALANDVCSTIIDIIKNGSCLFLYHPTYHSTNDLALK